MCMLSQEAAAAAPREFAALRRLCCGESAYAGQALVT